MERQMQLDRRAELVQRRISQRERRPPDALKVWQKENDRRAAMNAPPLKPPRPYRCRYSGAALRAIRARKVNFRGELQR